MALPFAAIGAVVSIGSALFGGVSARSAAKGQLKVAKANTEAQEITRKARNQYEGAATALSNYIRSANNNQILKAAGANYNAIGQNIARVYEQSERGKLTQRVQAAETLGTIAAAAAASGVGGSTVDMINSTFKRVNTIQRGAQEDQLRYQAYDMYQARSNIMANASASMDQGTTHANMDNSTTITPYVNVPSMMGSLISGISDALPYISQAAQQWSANAQASKASNANTGIAIGMSANSLQSIANSVPKAGANLRF